MNFASLFSFVAVFFFLTSVGSVVKEGVSSDCHSDFGFHKVFAGDCGKRHGTGSCVGEAWIVDFCVIEAEIPGGIDVHIVFSLKMKRLMKTDLLDKTNQTEKLFFEISSDGVTEKFGDSNYPEVFSGILDKRSGRVNLKASLRTLKMIGVQEYLDTFNLRFSIFAVVKGKRQYFCLEECMIPIPSTLFQQYLKIPISGMIVGPRLSGKSMLVNNILKSFSHVASPQNTYSDFGPARIQRTKSISVREIPNTKISLIDTFAISTTSKFSNLLELFSYHGIHSGFPESESEISSETYRRQYLSNKYDMVSPTSPEFAIFVISPESLDHFEDSIIPYLEELRNHFDTSRIGIILRCSDTKLSYGGSNQPTQNHNIEDDVVFTSSKNCSRSATSTPTLECTMEQSPNFEYVYAKETQKKTCSDHVELIKSEICSTCSVEVMDEKELDSGEREFKQDSKYQLFLLRLVSSSIRQRRKVVETYCSNFPFCKFYESPKTYFSPGTKRRKQVVKQSLQSFSDDEITWIFQNIYRVCIGDKDKRRRCEKQMVDKFCEVHSEICDRCLSKHGYFDGGDMIFSELLRVYREAKNGLDDIDNFDEICKLHMYMFRRQGAEIETPPNSNSNRYQYEYDEEDDVEVVVPPLETDSKMKKKTKPSKKQNKGKKRYKR